MSEAEKRAEPLRSSDDYQTGRAIKQRALASVLRRVRVLECATRDAAAEAQRLSDALRAEQQREAQRDDVAA